MANACNTITIVGYLGRDPEFSNTPSGKNLCKLDVGVKRNYKGKDGTSTSDFFKVNLWGPAALYAHNYAMKGDMVVVMGSMECNKSKEGKVFWTITSEAFNIAKKAGEKASTEKSNASVSADDYDPFEE